MSKLDDVLHQFRGKSVEQIRDIVAQHHIKGRMGTTYGCPMALLLDTAGAGSFIVGRAYIVRRSGTTIEKSRTPVNVAAFVRKFDLGGYPELIAPPPRCVANPVGKSKKRKDMRDRHTVSDRVRRPKVIKNHIAKLVNRFDLKLEKLVARKGA